MYFDLTGNYRSTASRPESVLARVTVVGLEYKQHMRNDGETGVINGG